MRWSLLLIALFLTACGAATPAPTTAPTATTAPAATATRAVATPMTTATIAPVAGTAAVTPAASGAISEYTDAKGNRILGSPNAPVTLTDFSDFL